MTASVYELRANLFKTLAHPARIRILEILRRGNHTVAELIPKVGLEASHLSHQLAVLRRAHLVHAHKAGPNVVYSIADPRVFRLLQGARDVLTRSLLAHQALLHELDTEPVHEVVLDAAAAEPAVPHGA
jgi:ArsR family transcriptional regulator